MNLVMKSENFKEIEAFFIRKFGHKIKFEKKVFLIGTIIAKES